METKEEIKFEREEPDVIFFRDVTITTNPQDFEEEKIPQSENPMLDLEKNLSSVGVEEEN